MRHISKRQHKKLCKKAAELIGLENCESEDGVYYAFSEDSGALLTEYDADPTWEWLVARFNGHANTIIDRNTECGISWAPSNSFIKATPKNVFAWARLEF